VSVLDVSDLCIDLDCTPLLTNISFQIAPGTITGLYGDSGCGKTTLALALLRLLHPARYRVRGSIRLDGQDLLSLPPRELQRIRGAKISMIFQDPLLALNPVMRVRRQVEEVLRAHACRASLDSLFAMAGLPAEPRILNAYPHQLSGGERQRVGIAQALACRPALMIADEPFTALDVIRVVELAALFHDLKEKTGTSFLLITHSPGVLKALADSTLFMERGRIDVH